MAELSENDFIRFKDLIHKESGIFFDSMNRSILESRLKERMRQKEIQTAEEYYHNVISDKKELETLLDSVTTNLTKFFRNEKQFYAFRKNILPEVIERNRQTGKKTLKIWSAGCSTGEEPYSIACEILNLIDPVSWKISILSSDISLKSLMKAKAGYYPKERIEGVPEEYLKKFFIEEKEGYRIKDEVKNNIRFDYHNLKHDNGERDFDIIFCRNVIIYFDKQEQERIVNHFYKCLKNPGHLFLGHSESLFGMQTFFKPLKVEGTFIYSKKED
ncbi:MAG TPA: chemotaxis protein CheR [Spirochaetia bacterium]|nr:MAG: chemotaxis protein CheR [Spirochaetes bacterium GWB1_36_13]HCL57687.1 chemotaxis protein CheR [Spirochaetia bacterium]